MAETARNIMSDRSLVSDDVCPEKTCVIAEKICRENVRSFREIVVALLLSQLLPQSCCAGKKALLVLL